MSRGHISRASRRHPSIHRQAARYGRTVRVRRAAGLPPHLLPGLTQRTKPKGSGRVRWLWGAAFLFVMATLFAGIAFIASAVASTGGTLAAYRDLHDKLPDAASIVINTSQSSKILDRNGTLLQEVDDPNTGWRTFVPYEQISPNVINATVAAEDATFWTHRGIEPLAIARGVVISTSGAGSSGGSTISQQLARGLFPKQIGFDIADPFPVMRKVKEGMAAVAIEREYSKHDILTMYLNQIFYGNRANGIEAAAETYFDKRAKDLTLGEASMLAGLPQAPTYYNPVENFPAAKSRQQYVLNQMVKYRYITQEQADAAFNQPLHPRTRSNTIQHAPHFVEYVKNYIRKKYGDDALFRGGLTITTTLDVPLQDRAQEILSTNVANLAEYNAHNGSMVVMLPWSGEILSMVGSANFDDPTIDGQVNVAVAERQPGSSIKPITYAAAFEKGWNANTVILDARFRVETPDADEPFYEPQNYTGQYYGPLTARTALSNSLNIPAVKALNFVGIDSFLDLAHRMGIKEGLQDRQRYGLALTLGGGEVQLLELTNVYSTFANNGKYVPVTPILKITDSQGNVLSDLDRPHTLERGQPVLKGEYASQISSILSDNKTRQKIFGPGNLFEQTMTQLGRPSAAKSGTTNDWKDNWTMGFTTDLVVGVWVGNSDNSALAQIDGIQGAGPIWSQTMIELHQNPEFSQLLLGPTGQALPKDFPPPPSLPGNSTCESSSRSTSGDLTPTTTSTTACGRPAA